MGGLLAQNGRVEKLRKGYDCLFTLASCLHVIHYLDEGCCYCFLEGCCFLVIFEAGRGGAAYGLFEDYWQMKCDLIARKFSRGSNC